MIFLKHKAFKDIAYRVIHQEDDYRKVYYHIWNLGQTSSFPIDKELGRIIIKNKEDWEIIEEVDGFEEHLRNHIKWKNLSP